MTQQMTFDDVTRTIICFGGETPLVSGLTLQPFGTVDLGKIVDGHGTGKLYAERYRYVGQPIALSLVEETPDGFEPFLDITKVYPPESIGADEVLVKMYSENESARDSLLGTGYFEDTGRRAELGFASLEVWRMTQRFLDAFCEANGPAIEATRAAIQ